jgi:DNA-directed RNA polymerase specialized sigma24 family protein
MPDAVADAPTFQSPPISLSLDTGDHDDGLAAFAPVRPRLFGIAYRMLGSTAEAEDIVQDVWLRWQCANRRAVENPAAFLATTTTRLSINLLQSAQSRHETYVGTWPLRAASALRNLSLPSPRISGEGSRSRGLMRTDKPPFLCRAMVNQAAWYRLMSPYKASIRSSGS